MVTPWKTTKLTWGGNKKPTVPFAQQTAAQRNAAAAAAQARAKAQAQKAGLTYYQPGKSGTASSPVPKAYSTAKIQAGMDAWNKQNPNASNYWWQYAPSSSELGAMMREDPEGYIAAYQAYNPIGGAAAPFDMASLTGGGGGGYGGGGGGGGGGAPAGMDQETLDYLSSIIGLGKPKDIAYEALDLPDPSQYYKWDNSQYGIAREGVKSGVQDIRTRANTAYDQALAMMGQYQNPYEGGLKSRNPDLQNAMQRMMSANAVQPGSVGATDQEATQRDRGMADTLALLAGVDQRREQGNRMGIEGDRRTTDINTGLEENMLNLGVNMSEAKAKNAFDQMLQGLRFQTDSTENTTNWGRRNQVGDTNAGASNAWMQNALNAYMSLIGQRAPGVTLPANGTLPWQV